MDVVKVLKSQDENYLRVKRAQDLKVGSIRPLLPTLVDFVSSNQKIDRLRAQLNAQADMPDLNEDVYEQLNEEEMEILSHSGILDIKGRETHVRRSKPGHVVFVEEDAVIDSGRSIWMEAG